MTQFDELYENVETDYHESVAERTRRERAAEKREVRDVVFGAALVYLVFFLVAWLK